MAEALGRAVARARAGGGPTLLEAMLGRMRGHSEGDDSLKVVPPEELAEYLAADPVPAYARRLEEDGALTPELRERLDLGSMAWSKRRWGEPSTPGPPLAETALRPVFAPAGTAAAVGREEPGREDGDDERSADDDGPPSTAGGGQPSTAGTVPADPGGNAGLTAAADEAAEPGAAAAASAATAATAASAAPAAITYVDAVHRALREEMERDPAVVLMGQDLGVFEGAFRTTRGLFARWPDRVLDTPIAESGTLGIAVGAAVLGFRPVVEMQFADFISCGFNQLVNVAAKLYYRWQVPCPIVVRLPSGGGVGAGPFHSQNPEGWFAHVAGLKIVCPATAADAYGLLKAAIRDPNPVLVFEHKYLYRRIKEVLAEGAGADGVEELGHARVRRAGGDLTLIGYGASTWTCLAAADELAKEGVEAEVVDLRTLVPYDEETVLASVQKTGRALVVHEDQAHRRLRRRDRRPPRRRRLPLARRPHPPGRLPRPPRPLRQEPRAGPDADPGEGLGGGAWTAGVLSPTLSSSRAGGAQ